MRKHWGCSKHGTHSGHGAGLSTIHANDCQSVLMKLEQYHAEVVGSDQKKTRLEAVGYSGEYLVL